MQIRWQFFCHGASFQQIMQPTFDPKKSWRGAQQVQVLIATTFKSKLQTI